MLLDNLEVTQVVDASQVIISIDLSKVGLLLLIILAHGELFEHFIVSYLDWLDKLREFGDHLVNILTHLPFLAVNHILVDVFAIVEVKRIRELGLAEDHGGLEWVFVVQKNLKLEMVF